MFNPSELIKYFCQTKSISAAILKFNVHRSTVYRWIRRAKNHSSTCKGYIKYKGLERFSRRPHRIRIPILTSEERMTIETLRREKGWCAERITPFLQRQGSLRKHISVSTIYRFLQRKCMIDAKKNHRRPLFQNTKHMHLKNVHAVGKLQMDVKYVTPELSGLVSTTFKYAVIDIYSRYKQGIILPVLDSHHAARALEGFLSILPFRPDFIQTDNGFEFQSHFISFCKAKGMKHHFIHKNTPNENAVIERSFRTDEEEFYFRLPRHPKDLYELNLWYQEYLREYNHVRPHLGLDCRTPMHIVANVVKE